MLSDNYDECVFNESKWFQRDEKSDFHPEGLEKKFQNASKASDDFLTRKLMALRVETLGRRRPQIVF